MRAILITIADAANRDGFHAHPGMAAIIEGSLYSEGHCRRVIAMLISQCWIELTDAGGGIGHCAEYHVFLDGEPERGERLEAAHPDARQTPPQAAHDARQTPKKSATSRAQAARKPRVGRGKAISTTPTPTVKPSAAVAAKRSLASDPLLKRADDLTKLAYDQPIKPAIANVKGNVFCAARDIIEAELKRGQSVQAIERAIHNGIDVWTTAGVQTAIAKAKPSNKGDPLKRGEESLASQLARVVQMEANERKALPR